MPTEGCRTLAEYVEALVEELGRADHAAALARMRGVVGSARRVRLDEESVDVAFRADRLVVEDRRRRPGRRRGIDRPRNRA